MSMLSYRIKHTLYRILRSCGDRSVGGRSLGVSPLICLCQIPLAQPACSGSAAMGHGSQWKLYDIEYLGWYLPERSSRITEDKNKTKQSNTNAFEKVVKVWGERKKPWFPDLQLGWMLRYLWTWIARSNEEDYDWYCEEEEDEDPGGHRGLLSGSSLQCGAAGGWSLWSWWVPVHCLTYKEFMGALHEHITSLASVLMPVVLTAISISSLRHWYLI